MGKTEDERLNPKVSDEPFRCSHLITWFLRPAHQRPVLPKQTSAMMTETQASLFFLC